MPSTVSVTFRPIWLIQSPFATVAMPPISTFRVASSMKNSTMNRCSPRRVHTSTVKKSAATISSQCRLDPVAIQNLSDRAARNFVPQIGQCALDPPIAPIPVLLCKSDYQLLDIDGCSRTPRSALRSAVVLVSDQLPMPGQQGLGRDNGATSA